MERPRYQDYVDELTQGRTYGIFIDDSGSPGLKDTPSNLHPDRKTWVAVIVKPALMPTVLEELPGALRKLKVRVGATEFHFADIYAGRKAFKDVGLDIRLSIFRFMALIFERYKFPILVQTLDPETLSDIRTRSNGQMSKEWLCFNFTRQDDTALFFLLCRLQSYMRETSTYPETKARVFVDEGFKKNGIGIKIPSFSQEFLDGLVCFADSSSILPIQLADFAAFTLNRQQILLGRECLSARDVAFLEIMEPVAFNYLNIPKIVISIERQEPTSDR